jgi:hypothetical protein
VTQTTKPATASSEPNTPKPVVVETIKKVTPPTVNENKNILKNEEIRNKEISMNQYNPNVYNSPQMANNPQYVQGQQVVTTRNTTTTTTTTTAQSSDSSAKKTLFWLLVIVICAVVAFLALEEPGTEYPPAEENVQTVPSETTTEPVETPEETAQPVETTNDAIAPSQEEATVQAEENADNEKNEDAEIYAELERARNEYVNNVMGTGTSKESRIFLSALDKMGKSFFYKDTKERRANLKKVKQFNKLWNDFRKISYLYYYETDTKIKDYIWEDNEDTANFYADEKAMKEYADYYQRTYSKLQRFFCANYGIRSKILCSKLAKQSTPEMLGRPRAKMNLLNQAYELERKEFNE